MPSCPVSELDFGTSSHLSQPDCYIGEAEGGVGDGVSRLRRSLEQSQPCCAFKAGRKKKKKTHIDGSWTE